jgi:hypothetical protein
VRETVANHFESLANANRRLENLAALIMSHRGKEQNAAGCKEAVPSQELGRDCKNQNDLQH